MREPLFLLELLIAVLLGMVGAVFLTTAGRVIRQRGAAVWTRGLVVTVLLFAALWGIDRVADGPELRILLVIALVILGTVLSDPLRTRVLPSGAETAEQ